MASSLPLLVLASLVVAGCGGEGDLDASVAAAGLPGMIRITELRTVYVNILPTGVKEKMDAGDDPTIIDVRAPVQYQAGHLPGAISMPLATLPWAMNSLDRDGELVVYCQIGVVSIRACNILAAAGFRDVENMVGGILAWPYALVSGQTTVISL